MPLFKQEETKETKETKNKGTKETEEKKQDQEKSLADTIGGKLVSAESIPGLPEIMGKFHEIAKKSGVVLPTTNFEPGTKPVPVKILIHHQVGLFELPDGNKVDEIEGIVIGFNPTNAYWEKGLSAQDGGSLPTCFSYLAVKPDAENPIAENCAACPFGQFGSADTGKGKKCRPKMRLFMLTGYSKIPALLTLNPMSLRSWNEYLTKLESGENMYFAVVTKFTLQLETGAFKYCIVKPEMSKPAEIDQVKSVIEHMKTLKDMQKTKITKNEEGVGVPEDHDGEPF